MIPYFFLSFRILKNSVAQALPSRPTAASIQKLEEAAINFISKCGCGHLQNQEKFAQIFSSVLHCEVTTGT